MTRVKNTSKKQPKIKHTGKTESEVDPAVVAKGLGADVTVDLLEQTPISGNLKVTQHKKDGSRKVRIIRQLLETELEDYSLLGTAEGQDPLHCLYLAGNHYGGDFWKKVRGYRVVKPEDKQYSFAVEFYGKKSAKG